MGCGKGMLRGTRASQIPSLLKIRYFRINKLREKWAKNAVFQKIVLDRKSFSVYFWCTSAYTCRSLVQDLTEREEADVRHEDKSQIGTMPGRQGLAVCLFARL